MFPGLDKPKNLIFETHLTAFPAENIDSKKESETSKPTQKNVEISKTEQSMVEKVNASKKM